MSWFACLEPWVIPFKHQVVLTQLRPDDFKTNESNYYLLMHLLLFSRHCMQSIVFGALLALLSLIFTTTSERGNVILIVQIRRLKARLGKFNNLPRVTQLRGRWRWDSDPGILDSKASALSHYAYLILIMHL